MPFTIRAEHLRKPEDSRETIIGIEDASQCEGIVCSEYLIDDDGQPVSPHGPHNHLVVSGENPKAAARYFAIEK